MQVLTDRCLSGVAGGWFEPIEDGPALEFQMPSPDYYNQYYTVIGFAKRLVGVNRGISFDENVYQYFAIVESRVDGSTYYVNLV